MSLKKTVYVPRFDSQLSYSQRDESISCSLVSLSQTPAPKLKPGKQQRQPGPGRTRLLVLTANLPKHGKELSAKKSKPAGPPWVLKTKVHQKKTTTVSQAEEPQSGGHGSDSMGEDAYNFSQSQSKQSKDEREKVKMAVLRNIARILAENNHIRQRLVSLSQVNRSHTNP